MTTAPAQDSPYGSPERRKGTATIWDVATGRPVFPALTLPYRVVDGLFLDEGRRFLTVMEIQVSRKPRDDEMHSELRVWSARDGQPVGEPIPVPLAHIRVELATTGDRLLLRGDHASMSGGSRAGTECQVRDAGSPDKIILPRGDEVWREARLSPDGRLVAAAPALVRPDWMPAAVRSRRGKLPLGVRATSDGRLVETSAGPVARLYRTSDGEPLPASLDHGASIDRIAFASDGRPAITSGGGTVAIWEVPTGRAITPPAQGQSFVMFSPDGRLMLMRAATGAPRAWELDRPGGRIVPASPPLPAAGWSPTIRAEAKYAFASPVELDAAFTADGREVEITSRNRLASATENRRWAIGEPGRGATPGGGIGMVLRAVAASITNPLPEVVLAPDDRTYLEYGKIRAVVMAAPTPGPDSKPRPPQPRGTPAFTRFAAESGKPIGTGPAITAPAVLPVPSADGRRVLLLSSEKFGLLAGLAWGGGGLQGGPVALSAMDFRALDLPSLEPAGPTVHLDGPVGALALSPDGRRLAVISGGTKASCYGCRRKSHELGCFGRAPNSLG
jgi:hypothetical protein